jgi:hypothetical protein
MTARRRTRPTILAVAGLLGLALTVPAIADAATVELRCAGKGPRNKDSAGTVLCAANPGKARKVAGTARNDAGQPVAGKLTITYSSWTPAKGGGYTVKPTRTREVVANADGGFSFSSNTKTRESMRVDLAADPDLGIAGGASAQAQVSRRLTTKVKKLGGGKIRITVKGTKHRPLKVYVLDPNGYELSGVKPRKADRKGRAKFDLGSLRGQFSIYVDSGVYEDLFWYGGRPKFRL